MALRSRYILLDFASVCDTTLTFQAYMSPPLFPPPPPSLLHVRRQEDVPTSPVIAFS